MVTARGDSNPLPSMLEKTNKALLPVFESWAVTILNIAPLWSEVKEEFYD